MAVDAVVMGLGRFGGGLAAAESLLAEGRQVLVTDLAEEAALQAAVTKLRETFGTQVRFRLGGHEQEDFAQAELVIANPAVPQPWDNPYLQTAWASGATVTTEIARTLDQLSDRKTIAITGSAGKSTTTAMTHAALVAAGIPATRGGNLGESLVGTPKDHTLVVELSSAMAWWLYEAPKAPRPTFDVALRTNLAPNHLDWHGDMAHYAQCKQAILDHAKVALDGSTLSPYEGELLVPGHHNRINAAAALAAVTALAPHRPATDFEQGTGVILGAPPPVGAGGGRPNTSTPNKRSAGDRRGSRKGPVRLQGQATTAEAVARALGGRSPGGTSWDQFENYEEMAIAAVRENWSGESGRAGAVDCGRKRQRDRPRPAVRSVVFRHWKLFGPSVRNI